MNVCIAALLQCVAIYSIKELELRILIEIHWASLIGKESTCNAGDLGLIPMLGRSPREGKGYLLQYSGLENSMDRIVQWGGKELGMTERLSLSFYF